MNRGRAELDPEQRRLLWRCRRGLKELDVLLERYARAALPHASPDERRLLARLLELPDPELAQFLLGGIVPPDRALAALAARIASWRRPVADGGRYGACSVPPATAAGRDGA
jgi:antitoxin CptB